MTPADRFHAHLDGCVRCRTTPFSLCAEGRLLRAAVDAYLRAPDEPNGYKPCPLCGSTIPDEPNELDDLRAEVERLRSGADEARRAERAEIVAWLREEAARYRGLEPVLSPAARSLEATAYLIETYTPHTMDLPEPGRHGARERGNNER